MDSTTSAQSMPSDEEILKAFRAVQEEFPDLGRNETLAKVKSVNGWTPSNKHLKKVVDPNRMVPAPEPQSTIVLPPNALDAQQRYKDQSTRCFKLYGPGEHDFGVSPNSE